MVKRKKNELPEVGTVFTHKYKGVKQTMTVVKASWGIGYEVSGTVYRSVSGAAKSVTGSAVNGWVFWEIEKPGARKNLNVH